MNTLVARLRNLISRDNAFEIDIRRTYFRLRMAAGLLGALLPIVLVGWGLIHGIAWTTMTSLSSFYWLSLLPPSVPIPYCAPGSFPRS